MPSALPKPTENRDGFAFWPAASRTEGFEDRSDHPPCRTSGSVRLDPTWQCLRPRLLRRCQWIHREWNWKIPTEESGPSNGKGLGTGFGNAKREKVRPLVERSGRKMSKDSEGGVVYVNMSYMESRG